MKWCFSTNDAPPESPRRLHQDFVPQPSPLSTKYLLKTPDDQDVWVEGRYRSSTGGDISYFRSARTGVCRKMEPPTGAHRCIRYRDNSDLEAVQADMLRGLSKDEIRSIPVTSHSPAIVKLAVRTQKTGSYWRRQTKKEKVRFR
jgi:hypothetical protein